MVVSTERTSLQIASGSTDTFTTGRVTGKILSIKISVSASSDFKISTVEGSFAEYIFGTSVAAITVAASKIFYPRIVGHLNTTGAALGAANNTNTYQKQAISSALLIEVSALSSDDTWSVEIVYEQ